MSVHRPSICIDFDGCLHPYSGSWNNGELADHAIVGALEGVREMLQRNYLLTVVTTRDVSSVERWLDRLGFPALTVTRVKPLCTVTLDDRAICFQGKWTSTLIEDLARFTPYWDNCAI